MKLHSSQRIKMRKGTQRTQNKNYCKINEKRTEKNISKLSMKQSVRDKSKQLQETRNTAQKMGSVLQYLTKNRLLWQVKCNRKVYHCVTVRLFFNGICLNSMEFHHYLPVRPFPSSNCDFLKQNKDSSCMKRVNKSFTIFYSLTKQLFGSDSSYCAKNFKLFCYR